MAGRQVVAAQPVSSSFLVSSGSGDGGMEFDEEGIPLAEFHAHPEQHEWMRDHLTEFYGRTNRKLWRTTTRSDPNPYMGLP